MSNNAIPNIGGGTIRDRMKIVPFGQSEPNERSRFKAGLAQALGYGRQSSPKSRFREGDLLGEASAVIADPTATDADLRAAFLRVSVTLEGALLHSLALEKQLRDLESTIAKLNSRRPEA